MGRVFCLFAVVFLQQRYLQHFSRTAECKESEEGEKWWEEETILECSLPTGQNTFD